jgi:cytochrome P450
VNSASPDELNALLVRRRQRGWLDMVARHGRTFRAGRHVLTREPTLVSQLLTERVHAERRSFSHHAVSKVTPGSAGLLFYEGERWLKHLRAAMPVFVQTHFASFGTAVHRGTVERARAWSASAPSDLYTAVSELGVDHILEIGYGVDPRSVAGRALARELVGYKLRTLLRDRRQRLDVLPSARKLLDLPWTLATWLDLRARVARLRAIVRQLNHDRTARLAGRPGWLDGLEREAIPFEELVDELNHLYGAYNAVDFTITAALFELSRHPEWRQRVRDELERVLGARELPEREDVPRLPELGRVIREVVRLYPVAMVVFRRSGAPIVVDGEELPAGTEFGMLSYALHRHPDFWPDPDRFDPTRWERSPEPPVPFSYIPFLEGPRKCIGRQLAEWEMTLVLAALTRCFDLDVLLDDADQTPFVIPRFAVDLPFRVRPRAAA